MGFVEQLAENTVSGGTAQAAGGIIGTIFGKSQDKRQLKQQAKLQAMQMQGNKEMMQFGKELDYDMWKKTGFVGQMEQIKAAGLSPGLIYGMGGASGTTTGGGTQGVSQGHAPTGGGENVTMAGQMAQLALLDAQRKNIEADTANKEADTANKPKIGANIESSTALNKLNEQIGQFEKEIKGRSVEATIRAIDAAAEKLMHEAVILRNQENISEATWQTEVDTKIAELATIGIQNNLTKQLTAESEQKVKSMIQDLLNKTRELDQRDVEITIKTFEANLKQEMPGIGQATGRILNGIINEYLHMTKKIGMGNKDSQQPINNK